MAWETAAGLAGMATVVATTTGTMVISGRPTKLKHLTAQTDMAAQSPSAGPSSQGDWSWQHSEADTTCADAAAIPPIVGRRATAIARMATRMVRLSRMVPIV